MIQLIYPENGAEISIITDWQKEFTERQYRGENNDEAVYDNMPWSFFERYDCGYPATLIFKWKRSNPLEPMNFKLSLNPDLSDECDIKPIATLGVKYASTEDSGLYCINATNLLSGKTYYWTVDNGKDKPEVRTFTTKSNEMRFIRFDGEKAGINVRDIGGKMTKYGRRIKQGLVYRGDFLEQVKFNVDTLTTLEEKQLREEFAFKTEIDFRYEAMGKVTKSVFGDNANYYLFPYNPYGGHFDLGMKEMVAQIISLFADINNYPIYIHCVSGADRTGNFSMVLESILGVSDEDMIYDYNATTIRGYTKIWGATKDTVTMTDILKKDYGADTLGGMFMNYVDTCNVPQEVLQAIKDIMLE